MTEDDHAGSCPMSQSALIEQSFMEHRNHLLALAAFLDRLDRSAERDAEDDFRLRALLQGVEALLEEEGGRRTRRVQMILSDRNSDLLEARDTQSAYGAASSTPHEGADR